MTACPDHSATPSDPLQGGLLIVTGASHTGKTSVIRSLLPDLEPPVALLGVDEVLAKTLVRPRGSRWTEIPLAYDLIRRQIDSLLGHGWLVIVETTFTYVSPQGEAEFHREVLEQMVGLAERHNAPWFLCQVKASLELTLKRAEQDRRLPSRIVAATVELHEIEEMPESALTLSAEDSPPEDLAKTLAAQLPAPFSRR